MHHAFKLVADWFDRVDPGTHRRIKGLRLVTAYGIAVALGTLHDLASIAPAPVSLGGLAGSFALWASVSEARTTRYESSRDLVWLCVAAAAGAALFALLASIAPMAPGVPKVGATGHAGGEWILISGAFAVGALKRYGVLGAGIGSQIYIGELTAYTSRLSVLDTEAIVVAALIAIVSAVVPRLLSGPAEKPALMAALASVPAPGPRGYPAEFVMGVQAASAALTIVVLNGLFGMTESAWAITACVYVVSGTAAGTLERGRRRVIGTLIGVPLALCFLPIVAHAPLLIWCAASIAMVVYAMALPERYDIACGAFAFTLLVTLAVGGEHSLPVLFARLWETVLGVGIGVVTALFVMPLREKAAERAVDSGSARK
ncbi:FUSC family protein [Paraburkholderia sp. ZP32-5]|uniref:FUSC family protein n=1 Tax=Paraburkholderia sp. ZP32-5 TaxID=2883245 RepID=UPI001F20F0F8|nr:FUSC family protein [Paraburkholderia sp. ZP32-5]